MEKFFVSRPIFALSLAIVIVVIVGYTSLGGFNAASMTDFIQSIIMTAALIIVLVFGVNKAGGMEQVIANANDLAGYLDVFKGYDAATNSAGSN